MALSLVFALTGCAGPESDSDNFKPVQLHRLDGSKVECMVYDNYNGGGISCDWARS